MAYTTMKKLIKNANSKYQMGLWTLEDYQAYKEEQQNKIDVFYAKGRITEAQYDELTGMWL